MNNGDIDIEHKIRNIIYVAVNDVLRVQDFILHVEKKISTRIEGWMETANNYKRETWIEDFWETKTLVPPLTFSRNEEFSKLAPDIR